MEEYKECEAYQIKEPAEGICIGGDGAKCETCHAHLRYLKKIGEDQ